MRGCASIRSCAVGSTHSCRVCQSATPIQDLAHALRPTDPEAVTAGLLHLAYHGVVDLPLDGAPITPGTAVTLRSRALPEVVA